MLAFPGELMFLLIVAGGFGLLIGSFLNVVVYRVPNGMSLVAPPSACPKCHSHIKAYDNVPIFSWLLLRGKCRNCHAPISGRYPLVEAGTGIFFLLIGIPFLVQLRQTTPGLPVIAEIIALVAFLYLGAISVALSIIDIETHTLPNRIVLPAYAVGVALLGTSAVLDADWSALIRLAIGGAALLFFYGIVWFIYPKGMGFGDVKLAGVIGLYLGFEGWAQLLVGAFAAFLIGGLFAIATAIIRHRGRGHGIPFGPFMLAGAWIGIFFGAAIGNGYLSLFGLSAG